MSFEYDPVKSQSNKAKHGIDFAEAQALWRDDDRLLVDTGYIPEQRTAVIGLIAGVFWTAIVTPRGEAVRIISCRRARKEEVALDEHEKTDSH